MNQDESHRGAERIPPSLQEQITNLSTVTVAAFEGAGIELSKQAYAIQNIVQILLEMGNALGMGPEFQRHVLVQVYGEDAVNKIPQEYFAQNKPSNAKTKEQRPN